MILAISFLVLASAVASRWPVPVTAQPPEALRWVRTVDGWEPSANLLPRAQHKPSLHPFTLAALQLLGAGVALAAADWKKREVAEDAIPNPVAKHKRRRNDAGVRPRKSRQLKQSNA